MNSLFAEVSFFHIAVAFEHERRQAANVVGGIIQGPPRFFAAAVMLV